MIVKVEPLTTARALRGPFDYRLGEKLAAAGVGVGSVLVVPFGHRRLLGVVLETADRSDIAPERLAEPLEVVEPGVPSELVSLGLWVAQEYVSTPARGLSLVLPPGTGTGGGRPTQARTSLSVGLTDTGRAALEDGTRLGPRQRAALEALQDASARISRLAASTGIDHAGVRRLEERGLVAIDLTAEPLRRPHLQGVGAREEKDRELTTAQAEALEQVRRRMEEPGVPKPFLLHGVTGSGKTEVYLRAVEAALALGRTAIVLVPEIALTPQTAGRFVDRFGDTVAVLHSRLTVRERYDEWSRLRAGDARVAVGPRSAVFAPLENVGLIVVDEEHDSSYKQEGDPRYDARNVAERRASESGAVLLVGSATPRPESVLAYERLRLPERVDGRGMPPVDLVGMAGTNGPLHQVTRDALEEVRSRGQKAIVLLNRRGWSNFLTCRDCGRTWGCPNCDVVLVLHRAARMMACHHCGHREELPKACPDCGSVSLARHGIGTEQLWDELTALMDPLPVLRLDADTVGGAGETLEEFDSAPAGVLVGTQMVAKGHDFPDVTLGVVLDADSTLRFPDFRSEERTFALVAQLAGRSGRGRQGGRVVVQALDPEARALRYAAEHDADGFLEKELQRRQALLYPPYGSLIRVVCSSTQAAPAMAAAKELRKLLSVPGARVLGPAPLFRLKQRERVQLMVKGQDRAAAIVAVRGAVEAIAELVKGDVSLAVDVDPQ